MGVDAMGTPHPGFACDFNLADLLTVDQIVDRYPVLTRGELLSAMRSKRLRHWPKGRQRFTTERWVREWIMTQVRGGDEAASEGGPAAVTAALRNGRKRGSDMTIMTPKELSEKALALARQGKAAQKPKQGR